MKTILALGYGPEAEFVLQNQAKITDRQNVELVRVNVRAVRREPNGLPLINPFGLGAAARDYKGKQFSKIATAGSLSIAAGIRTAGLLLSGDSFFEFWELQPYIRRADSGDAGRLYLSAKYRDYFEMPPLREVIPFAFAPNDVVINERSDLLAKAKDHSDSDKRDSTIILADARIRIYRVPRNATHLINRRLSVARLQEAHQKFDVKHFFFDRHRTTILGDSELKQMVEYAEQHRLTLQSFID